MLTPTPSLAAFLIIFSRRLFSSLLAPSSPSKFTNEFFAMSCATGLPASCSLAVVSIISSFI